MYTRKLIINLYTVIKKHSTKIEPLHYVQK